jgi:hypothetical protein
MNRPMIGAIIMALLLSVYLAFTANYAWILINDSVPLVVAMGYALVVLPVLGAWGLVLEMRFAMNSQRLMTKLENEKLVPDSELPRLASGRPDKAIADEAFPAFAEAVERHPMSWQHWMRLGLAYDACGDRRRARWAVRRAISLAKQN